jgi:hypothetical protein
MAIVTKSCVTMALASISSAKMDVGTKSCVLIGPFAAVCALTANMACVVLLLSLDLWEVMMPQPL